MRHFTALVNSSPHPTPACALSEQKEEVSSWL